MFAGFWAWADIRTTASENIQLANPMRHLLIAALVDGQCGSPGLPD